MKLILGSALCLVFVFCSNPCFAQILPLTPPEPAPVHDYGDNSPDVVLCMGDSITQGYEVSASDTYPAKLQGMLGRTVINEGLGGARSTYGVRMVGTYLNRYKPGYLLIMFGANDIGENSEDEIADNLRYMVHRAKENKTLPILATLTPVAGSRIGKKSTIIRVNDRIRTMTTEESIPLADVAEAFNWDEHYLISDGLHPTVEGLELIAKTFYDTILAFEDQGGGGGSGGGGGCTVGVDRAGGWGEFLLLLIALTSIYLTPRLRRPGRRE